MSEYLFTAAKSTIHRPTFSLQDMLFENSDSYIYVYVIKQLQITTGRTVFIVAIISFVIAVAVRVGRSSRRNSLMNLPYSYRHNFCRRLRIFETNFLCHALIATSTAAEMRHRFSAVYGSVELNIQAGAPLYLKRYENVLKTPVRRTVAPKSSPSASF